MEVDFIVGDLFRPLDRSLRHGVDLIVSNPPYVSSGGWQTLPPEVRDYEPYEALVAGACGTEILGAIAAEAHAWLRHGGRVICEIGETQGGECRRLFAAYDPEILEDLTGRPRYVLGTASQMTKLH
jgi:release factor glutamine methyltransferase